MPNNQDKIALSDSKSGAKKKDVTRQSRSWGPGAGAPWPKGPNLAATLASLPSRYSSRRAVGPEERTWRPPIARRQLRPHLEHPQPAAPQKEELQQAVPAPTRPQLAVAFSQALDLAEGRQPGHAARVCHIALRLAEAAEAPRELRQAIFYGALLHDAGAAPASSGLCRELNLTEETLFGGKIRPVAAAAGDGDRPTRRPGARH